MRENRSLNKIDHHVRNYVTSIEALFVPLHRALSSPEMSAEHSILRAAGIPIPNRAQLGASSTSESAHHYSLRPPDIDNSANQPKETPARLFDEQGTQRTEHPTTFASTVS